MNKTDAMKGVQKQKIAETLEMIFQFHNTKQKFMKAHFPIQQILVKKIEKTTQITIQSLKTICHIIKQERQSSGSLCEFHQKSLLNHEAKFKIVESKQKSETGNPSDWNKNIGRVLQGMSSAHKQKLTQLKAYNKIVDNSYNEIFKEQSRYRSDVKNLFKQFNRLFAQMDMHEKDQTKILAKITKQAKSKDQKDSIFFLTQVKKLQNQLILELTSFINRNKLILDFVKGTVKNEKAASKKLKEHLNAYLSKKKTLFKESQEAEKIWGLLAVLEDNVQETRQRYLQKNLITKDMIDVFTTMVPAEKSKIHHMIKYLSLGIDDFGQKLELKKTVHCFSKNLCFKAFQSISLAQGWLITSYTKAVSYLTYDHFFVIFDQKGEVMKKIQTKSSKINKVSDDNIVFLQELVKGFFKDSKEQYQIKFDDSDRMEQFILYMQNQVV